jgi:hypothetical protein
MVPMWFAKMGPIMTTLMAQLPPIWAPFVLLAGALLQDHEGDLKHVAYASKTLTGTQEHMPAQQPETLKPHEIPSRA